jgi:uroporphyrinogen-III synthase
MRRVLVLRPEPGASATIKRARALGLEPVGVPLFEVEPLPWEAPAPGAFDGLLLTSANAVRHGGAELLKLRGLEVYAVGDATAEATREAGFDIAATGEAGIDRLLASIEPALNLLHPCAEDRREAPQARQRILSIPVYRAKTVEAPELAAARGAVLLVHSPRAARRLAELTSDRASIAIAAISAAAAEAVGDGWESVEAAPEPNDDALLALAARLCNNPPPE